MGLSATAKFGMLTPAAHQSSAAQQHTKIDNNLKKEEEKKAPVTNPFDYSQEQINNAMAAYSTPVQQTEGAATLASNVGSSNTEGCGSLASSSVTSSSFVA